MLVDSFAYISTVQCAWEVGSASRKSGIGGGGWFRHRLKVYMVADVVGYRKALVSIGWAISSCDSWIMRFI